MNKSSEDYFKDLRIKWDEIQTYPPKQKYKALASFGNQIKIAHENNPTIEELEWAMDKLKKALKMYPGHPSWDRALSMMSLKKLDLLGIATETIEVVAKKAGKIDQISSLICCGDPTLEIDLIDVSSEEELAAVNEGRMLLISTSGRGLSNVQVRLVNLSEPVLKPKEYKKALDSTPTVVLSVPSGKFTVADLGSLNDLKDTVSLKLEPGFYKVCVFLIENARFDFSYYVVLAKTTNVPKNDLTDIPDLDYCF